MTRKQAGLMQAAFVAVCAAAFVFGAGGCATVEGVGHAFQGLGKDVSDVARWSGERIDNGFNRKDKR